MSTQKELEGQVLHALYRYMNERGDWLTIAEISGLLDHTFAEGRIEMAIGALVNSDYVDGSYSYLDPNRYKIGEKGYKYAEELLADAQDSNSYADEAEAPASDRVVGFDHNSSELREILETTEKLKNGLSSANDVGKMSPRAVSVAVEEVEILDRSLRLDFLRPNHVWRVAKSTLQWIGHQAAGALVGQVALTLLVLIATFFGIAF